MLSLRRTLLFLIVALVAAARVGASDDVIELQGVVAVVSDAAVVVQSGGARLECARGATSPALHGITVGERVRVRCELDGERHVLATLARVEAKPPERLKARGPVVVASEHGIAVQGENGNLACVVPERLAAKVAALERGDVVAILCRRREGRRPELVTVERARAQAAGELVTMRGRVVARGEGSLEVQGELGGLACAVPAGLQEKVARLSAGDRVAIGCRKRDGKAPELVKLERLEVKAEAVAEDLVGVVVSLRGGSLTVENAEAGRSLTCTVPDELAAKLATLEAGERVKLLCKGGVLAALVRAEVAAETPKAAPAPETKLVGRITALSAGSISVTGDASLTCRIAAAWRERLARFAVGDAVKLLCRSSELVHLERR